MISGRALTLLAVTLSTAIVVARQAPSSQRSDGPALNPQFEQLVDRYLADARTGGGDMGAGTFAKRLDAQRALLKDLQAIDRKALTFDQGIDYRFLESILKTNVLKGERVKRWQQDLRPYININSINGQTSRDMQQAWRQAGVPESQRRGFHFSPDTAFYCAWFAPEEKGFCDYRPQFFPDVTTTFFEMRKALAPAAPGSITRETSGGHRLGMSGFGSHSR